MKPISILSLLYSRTDEEAMTRVRTHDDHAEFAQLVKRWEEPIRRVCVRMTGDAHRGEDLKQETFLKLFQKRKDYEPRGRFSTFLWRIAMNLCYDDLRRRQRRPELVALDSEDVAAEPLADAPGPDSRAAVAEEGEMVRQALMQLPEIYRAVLVLRHYENLRLAKIAEILEIPEGTVNSRMAEALSRLSQLLEPRLQRQSARSPSVLPKGRSPFDTSHFKQVSL
jgi:RNA polymerase sigma-70 factor (ECF subfamily)